MVARDWLLSKDIGVVGMSFRIVLGENSIREYELNVFRKVRFSSAFKKRRIKIGGILGIVLYESRIMGEPEGKMSTESTEAIEYILKSYGLYGLDRLITHDGLYVDFLKNGKYCTDCYYDLSYSFGETQVTLTHMFIQYRGGLCAFFYSSWLDAIEIRVSKQEEIEPEYFYYLIKAQND